MHLQKNLALSKTVQNFSNTQHSTDDGRLSQVVNQTLAGGKEKKKKTKACQLYLINSGAAGGDGQLGRLGNSRAEIPHTLSWLRMEMTTSLGLFYHFKTSHLKEHKRARGMALWWSMC